MKRTSLIFALIAVSACASPKAPEPVATNEPAPKAQKGYSGHGEGSISPDVLARYAPPKVPAAELAKIQAYLDIRSPSSGTVSDDGKTLYMSWSVTGTRQIWRMDKTQGFPVQLTGGQDATSMRGLLPNGQGLVVSRDRSGSEYYGLYLQDAQGGAL